jgi:hypothetical protein
VSSKKLLFAIIFSFVNPCRRLHRFYHTNFTLIINSDFSRYSSKRIRLKAQSSKVKAERLRLKSIRRLRRLTQIKIQNYERSKVKAKVERLRLRLRLRGRGKNS